MNFIVSEPYCLFDYIFKFREFYVLLYCIDYYVDNIPTRFPHCGKQVALKLLTVIPEKNIDTLDYKKETKHFSFIFQCDVSCRKIIVAIYKKDDCNHK
jgi:hypothetical protein